MQYKYPNKKEVEIAAKIVEMLDREKLIQFGCKNFKPVVTKDLKYGVKFNLPTNKTKGNRCTIVVSEHFLDQLQKEVTFGDFLITSEYFDKNKDILVVNKKSEALGLNMEIAKQLFWEEVE